MINLSDIYFTPLYKIYIDGLYYEFYSYQNIIIQVLQFRKTRYNSLLYEHSITAVFKINDKTGNNTTDIK